MLEKQNLNDLGFVLVCETCLFGFIGLHDFHLLIISHPYFPSSPTPSYYYLLFFLRIYSFLYPLCAIDQMCQGRPHRQVCCPMAPLIPSENGKGSVTAEAEEAFLYLIRTGFFSHS